MGLAVGAIAWCARRPGLDANALAEAFREGCAQMLPVVLVVALAESLMLLLGGTDPAQPSVLNTLLYHLAHALEGLSASVAASLMLVVQAALNFLVPSGSDHGPARRPARRQPPGQRARLPARRRADQPDRADLGHADGRARGAARIDWLQWARFIAGGLAALFGLSIAFVVGAVFAGYA